MTSPGANDQFKLSDTRNVRQALIITALPPEYMAVRKYLEDITESQNNRGVTYECGRFCGKRNQWDVGLVQLVEPGDEHAALTTQEAIQFFNPSLVMFVGVAGGLKDVRLGDVVVATKVYAYASGAAEREFLARPDVVKSDSRLLSQASLLAKDEKWGEEAKSPPCSAFRVFVAPIAAGPVVLKDTRSSLFQFLRHNYGDAVAVEMEGSGFLKAAWTHAVSAVVVRGISDLVDEKTQADSSGSQLMAATHAAAFAFELLDRPLRKEPAIRCLLVDDHTLFRGGMRELLEKSGDIVVVGDSPNASDAIEKAAALCPDIVLMDIGMQGLSAFDAVRAIREHRPATKVVILTMYTDEDYFAASVRIGASGYVLKDMPVDQLVNMVRAVYAGAQYFDTRLLTGLLGNGGTRAANANSEAETAHIVFAGLVGHESMQSEEQRRAIQQLYDLVGKVVLSKELGKGKNVPFATAEGIALAYFGEVKDALQDATKVGHGLKAYPDLRVRIGVESGLVYRYGDTSMNMAVAKGGLSKARVLMSYGDAGHILLSEKIAKAAKVFASRSFAWKGELQDLGTVTSTSGSRVHIFNLFRRESYGNTAIPEQLKPQSQIAS